MKTLRVLVADDQEHMRELMAEALSADGHTVDPAEGGMAAAKRRDRRACDRVVSDLQMPQVDGPKLYEEIRKRRPDAVPHFIFITGEDEAPGYGRFLSGSQGAAASKPAQ